MGARTTAMGGASDALTPDGTDLAGNPVLIAALKQAVVSLSGAQTQYAVVRLSATPDLYLFDREARRARSLSHVAAAIPLHGFVVGLYARQEPELRDGPNVQLADFIQVDYEPSCAAEPCIYAYGLGHSAFRQTDRRYGLTVAKEYGRLAVGAGAELQDTNETYNIWRVGLPMQQPFMERVTRSTSARRVVPNAGVRYRISPRIALAAAYNGAAARERVDTACLGDWGFDVCVSPTATINTMRVRGVDSYRASVSVAPLANLVLVAEGVRRNYGKLANETSFPATWRNVNELRAGVEYRLRNAPVFIRAGYWSEPSKIVENNFFGAENGSIAHRTIGAGLDVSSTTRVDLAYDDADVPSQRRAVVGVAFRTGH